MPTAHDPHPASQLRSLHDRSALHAEHRLAGAVVAPVGHAPVRNPDPDPKRAAARAVGPVRPSLGLDPGTGLRLVAEHVGDLDQGQALAVEFSRRVSGHRNHLLNVTLGQGIRIGVAS